MARKDLKLQETKADKNLDFDDFEFDFKPPKKDRNPVISVGKVFAKSAARGATDSTMIESMLKNNLPKEYGQAYELLQQVRREGRDFADDVTKKTKPIIKEVAQSLDKLLPPEAKRTKDKLNKLAKWASSDEYKSISIEELREQGLNAEIARVFSEQQRQDALRDESDKTEKSIDRSIAMTQHKDILSTLTKIANNTYLTTSYTTGVNTAFQKKSLETQYRQLFALKDILEETRKSNAEMKLALANIQKNTALPDYKKTTKLEAGLSNLRNRFMDRTIDGTTNFFKKGFQNVRKNVDEKISMAGLMSSFLSMYSGMAGGEFDFGEEEKTKGEKRADFVGKHAGEVFSNFIAKHLFAQAKKSDKMTNAVVKGQNFLTPFLKDGAGIFTDFARKLGFDKEGNEKKGAIGTFARLLLDNFKLEKPSTSLANLYDPKTINEQAPYTNRNSLSLNEVIPGYLARILLETERIRTGLGFEATGSLLKYDIKSGKFDTQQNIINKIKDSFSSENLARGSSGYKFQEIFADLEDKDNKNDAFTPDQRNDIAQAIIKHSLSGESSSSPKRMTDYKYWMTQGLDEKTAKLLARRYLRLFGTNKDSKYIDPRYDIKKKAMSNQHMSSIRDLPSYIQNFKDQTQDYKDMGLGDEARQAGLIDTFGQYDADLVARNTATLGKDFTPAKRVRPVDPQKAFKESEWNQEHMMFNPFMMTKELLKTLRTPNPPTDEEINEYISKGYMLHADGDWYDTEGRPVKPSDVKIKTNIKKPKNGFLNALNNLKVKAWKYKEGFGDGGGKTNIGPMAQDVQQQLGPEVGVDSGTKIDLLNMNGSIIKAIQELNEKVDRNQKVLFDFFGIKDPFAKNKRATHEASPLGGQTHGGTKNSFTIFDYLKGIYENSSKTVKQNEDLIKLNIEAVKNFATGLGVKLGNIDLKDATEGAKNGYEKAKEKVKDAAKNSSASSLLGKLGDFITNNASGMFFGGLSRATKFVGKVKQTIQDANIFDKIKNKAFETFDVFVEGEKEPRMIYFKVRLGKYLNFETQKPVFTREDIKHAKQGIVETLSDGRQEFVLQSNEFEKAYFVNRYKKLIERVAKSTLENAAGLGRGIAEGLVPGLKAINMLRSKLGGLFGGLTKKLLDQPVDIYLKSDMSKPVLYAKKMRMGHYIDRKTRTAIEKPGDIQGEVYDAYKREIALSEDDFTTGLVDINGDKIENIKLRFLKTAAATVIGGGAALFKSAFQRMRNLPGHLGKLSKAGTAIMKKTFETLGLPKIIIGGVIGADAVDILKDIRAILRDMTGLGGDDKELTNAVGKYAKRAAKKRAMRQKKELLDPSKDEKSSSDGKASGLEGSIAGGSGGSSSSGGSSGGGESDVASSSGLTGRLVKGIGKGIVSGGSKALGWLASKAKGKAGIIGTAGGILAGLLAKKPAAEGQAQEGEQGEKKSVVDKTIDAIKSMSSKIADGSTNQDTKKKEMIAQAESGGKSKLRVGSWQWKNLFDKNVNEKKEGQEVVKAKKFATTSIFSMIAGILGTLKGFIASAFTKLAKKFLPKKWVSKLFGEAEELGSGKLPGTGGIAEGAEKGAAKTAETAVERSAGKAATTAAEKTAAEGAAKKGLTYRIGEKVGSAVNKVKGWFGKKAVTGAAEAAEGVAGKQVAKKGLMSVGSKLGGFLGVRSLGSIGLAAGAGMSAKDSYDSWQKGNKKTAILHAGLAAAQGVGAVATAGGMIALLSNPVGWAIAGGLAVYGLYKLATRKKFNYTEQMRFLEYGLRGGDIDLMRKIFEFEEYIAKFSKLDDSGFNFDLKKVDASKIYDIFSIDEDDQKRTQAFAVWRDTRFKPIFGKWKMLSKQVCGNDDLKCLEKATIVKQLEIFKLFKLSTDVYSVAASPFKFDINTDASVITNYRDQWLVQLNKEALSNKDAEGAKETAELGKVIGAAKKEGKSVDDALNKANKDQEKPGEYNVNGQNRTINDTKQKLKLDGKVDDVGYQSSIRALDAIKFKCYGLGVLKLINTRALQNFESVIIDYVKLDPSGKASFDGDIQEILKRSSSFFGVTNDDPFAKTWIDWFTNRFLPVFLNYHSAIFNITKRNDIKNNYKFIEVSKASEKLIIARAIIGTNNIWNVKALPFKNLEPNMDIKSCDVNIEYLENDAKQETAQEEKADNKDNSDNKSNNAFNSNANKPGSDAAKDAAKKDNSSSGSNTKQSSDNKPTPPNNNTPGSQAVDIDANVKPGSVSATAGGVSAKVNIDSDTANAASSASSDGTSSSTSGGNSKFDVDAACKRLQIGSQTSTSGGLCATNVSRALLAGGLKFTTVRHAKQYVEVLPRIGFVKIASSNGGCKQRGFCYSNPQKGDVCVMPPYPGDRNVSGHISMFDGKVWRSDFCQIDFLGGPGYRNNGVFTAWRHRSLGGAAASNKSASVEDNPSNAAKISDSLDNAKNAKDDQSATPSSSGGASSVMAGNTSSSSTSSSSTATSTSSTTASATGGGVTVKTSPSSAANQDIYKPNITGDLQSSSNKVSSAPGATNANAATVNTTVAAANDGVIRASANIANSDKSDKTSVYASLPDSNGNGWKANCDMITAACKAVGVDPAIGTAIACKESGLNPKAIAGSSSAKGMYQFIDDTWGGMMRKHGKKYGIPANASPMDPKANTLLGLEYIKESLKNSDGTVVDAYLGHLLGPGGANTFRNMKDTDLPATSMQKAARANASIFYNNGKPRTKAEIKELLANSLSKQLTAFQVPLHLSDTALASKKDDKQGSPSAVAANDDSIGSSSQASSSTGTGDASSPSNSTGDAVASLSKNDSALTKTSYTPQDNTAVNAVPSAIENNINSIASNAPAASVAANTPAIENKNNGIGNLEKINTDHLKESKKTNDILVEIRDLLKQNLEFNAGNTQQNQQSKPDQKSVSVSSPVQKVKANLPDSFIQRRRA